MLDQILIFIFYIFWTLITILILTNFTIFVLKINRKELLAQKIQNTLQHYTSYFRF